MKKEIRCQQAPDPVGPYSQAILSGNTIYVSGQIALDKSSGTLLTEDRTKEAHLVLQNIRYLLVEAGFEMDNIVKCSIFLKNLGDFNEVNSVYETYFNHPFPARVCVEVSRLPKDVNVEISCIAIK